MKNFFTCLILLLLILPAAAQKLRQTTSAPIPVSFSSSNNDLISLDQDRFVLLSRLENENLLTAYNTDLEELFTISIDRTFYYPLFEYLPELDAILIFLDDEIEGEGKKEAYRVSVFLYSAKDGKMISEKVLRQSAEEPTSIYFSKNKRYFCLDKSSEPGHFETFQSKDLTSINTFGRDPSRYETTISVEISNEGKGLLVYQNQNQYISFDFFDLEGNLKNTVKGGRDLESRHFYSNHRLIQHSDQQGHFILSRSHPKYLYAVDIWKIDFANAAAAKVSSYEFNKNNIRNDIYKRTYERAELDHASENYGNTPFSEEKGPSKLKNVVMNSAHYTANDGFVVVLEELKKRISSRDPAASGMSTVHRIENTDHYYGNDVMVVGFTPEGGFSWGCAYERKAATKTSNYGMFDSGFHLFHPSYSGVRTAALSDTKQLHLINFEYRLLGRYGPYYRSFDMITGELLHDRPLLDEDQHTVNTNYVDLIGEKSAVLLTKMGIDFYVTPEKLQLISVDLP